MSTYPKVTMKTISFVMISCYSIKEWIECYKKKQLVKRELNKLKPILYFIFGANEEFLDSKWKKFKKDYNVISATMQVLPEALGKEFFSSAKQTRNKNRSIERLYPYVRHFFHVFLKQKKAFVKQADWSFFGLKMV
jgi:hypothetical protein